MGRNVWETKHAFAKPGYQVQVLSETCVAEKLQGITLHKFGAMAYRSRRLYCGSFGRRMKMAARVSVVVLSDASEVVKLDVI